MGRSLEHANFTFPRGYLFGLTLSTAGSSTTFSVAAGEAVDSTFVGNMTLGSSISKTTSAWAVGSTNGALDTGTIANNTWYHVYLIKRLDTGVVDVLISLSATSPTLPTNYTIFRRIGSMKTNGSAQWVLFYQVDDKFLWDITSQDLNDASTVTTARTATLNVPVGIRVHPIINIVYTATSGDVNLSVLDQTDSAPTNNNTTLRGPGVMAGLSAAILWTNTLGQIRYRVDTASATVQINTFGWIDTRGKLS